LFQTFSSIIFINESQTFDSFIEFLARSHALIKKALAKGTLHLSQVGEQSFNFFVTFSELKGVLSLTSFDSQTFNVIVDQAGQVLFFSSLKNLLTCLALQVQL